MSAPLVLAGPEGTAAQEWRASTVAGTGRPTAVTGARVYLHAPRRRGYLGTVMARQVGYLADDFGADDIHIGAGWLGGPHYDLRAVAAPGPPIDWPLVAAALAEGARHMPATPQSEADYLRNATGLGRIESVPPPYLPLRPHGYAETLGPEYSAAGQGGLAALRTKGLALMLSPLLRTAATEGDGALMSRVAEAFLALADCHPFGLRFGTFSFRSHAEAFFHWAGPVADYRTSFTTRMQGDQDVLRVLARRAQEGAESAGAMEWRSAFQACLATFTGQVTEDDLDQAAAAASGGSFRAAGPAPAGPAPAGPAGPAPAGPASRPGGSSVFHTAVAASGVIDEPPEWFAAFRLTINLFYQLLPALDVSPVQRFYLCHAIAEVVDDAYGETWQARLAALEAHRAVAR